MLLLAFFPHNGEAARDRIVEAVRREPGIHPSALKDRVNLSWSTVRYHLRILSVAKKIHLVKEDREVRAFPLETPPAHRRWLAALRDDDATRVLGRLLQHPSQSVPQLGDALGLSHKVIRRSLTNLEDSGLVVRRGDLRPVFDPNAKALPELLGAGLAPRWDDEQWPPPSPRSGL